MPRRVKTGERPHGNTVIWRYMGLGKFLDVVLNQRLYFVPAELLTDRYEAWLPKEDLESLIKSWERELPKDEVDRRTFALLQRVVRDRARTLVNSWSKGPDESYGLWKIYLSGARNGVAIRTTVSRLARAIANGRDEFGERVKIRWVNYTHRLGRAEPTWEEIITRKAPYYEYEREIRCFARADHGLASYDEPPEPPSGGWGVIGPPSTHRNDPKGRHVTVDLSELAMEIYVSPFAAPWFREVLLAFLDRVAPSLSTLVKSSGVRDV